MGTLWVDGKVHYLALVGCYIYSLLLFSHEVMSDSACLWTSAWQAPLPMGFSIQEYWSRLSFPSPGDPPDSGIEPKSPALAGTGRQFFTSDPLGQLQCE